MMDCINLKGNVCRICLDRKVILNWDEEIFEFCGTSYKDCYHKYTQLDKSDSDCYPKNLCEICADELKNAHFLFEKALESFNILQVTFASKNLKNEYFDVEISNSDSKLHQVYNSNEVNTVQLYETVNPSDEEFLVDHLPNIAENESPIESGNADKTEDISMSTNIMIEPSHFIDIQSFQTSDQNLLEQFSESCDALPKSLTSSCSKKRNKLQSVVTKISNEDKRSEISDIKFSHSSDIKNGKNERLRKKENCESQSLLEQNRNESYETNSSNRYAFKRRKKYILICQYCSLKVDGTNQLKIHEATHSENRKRTETCPQCGVKLYTKMALNEHMKIHKENRQKEHKCEFCEKAFFNKGGLNVHRRIHLGQMVKCQICTKEFFRQIDLDKHLLRHSVSPLQKMVGKKKYVVQCQYCSKSVLTDKWKEHTAAHLDQPQMKCKICDKKFFSRSNCTKHLRQVHHKTLIEYKEFIHYFVDRNSRISNLRMRQQLGVQQLME